MRSFATTLVASLALLVGCEDYTGGGQGTFGEQNQGEQFNVNDEDQLGTQQDQVGSIDQQGQQGMTQGQTASINGTVQEVDQAKGTVTIETQDQGNVDLKGSAKTLAGLVQGQQVNLTVQQYDNERWIEKDAMQGQAKDLTASRTVEGNVDSVDMAKGTLKVKGQNVRAHPEDLKDIQQGQVVAVQVAEIDTELWAIGVEPRAEGQTARMEGDQQQQQDQPLIEGENEPLPQ